MTAVPAPDEPTQIGRASQTPSSQITTLPPPDEPTQIGRASQTGMLR